MKQTKIAATFSDADEAAAVKSKLGQIGIDAVVSDESNLQKFLFMSKPLASYKVLVEPEDFEKARLVLQAADVQDHLLQHEVCWPQVRLA